MKRTGCPDRSCPRELRAKGAGVQYVHRFDHTCRIVSFPVGKRYDFGFADSRAFCFCAGRARRIAPTRVWRFCTAPPLPRFAFRTGSASFHAAVRDPNRFSSPAQVRAGRAGPFRTPPQSPAAAPAASFAQRARLCAEPVRVPGPGPSRPCSPIFAVRRALCHCIFFPVQFDLPCVPDRRTKIAAEKFPPPSRFSSIYVRTGYKTQWPNHTGRFNISHSAGQFCSLPPHGRGTGRPCMLPIFNLISVIIGCSADKYVK